MKRAAALLTLATLVPIAGSSANEITEPTPVVQEEQTYRWSGPGLSINEQTTLKYFQDIGITDRAALAVILGNIKQESKFHPNICEGGSRIEYHRCRRGGYGLIQWTTTGRYDGLGRHARATGGDPSSLMTQLSYIPTEREWKKIEHLFKKPGQSINFYMKAADSWLGWGVYGARGTYSYQYYDLLVENK